MTIRLEKMRRDALLSGSLIDGSFVAAFMCLETHRSPSKNQAQTASHRAGKSFGQHDRDLRGEASWDIRQLRL